PCVHVARLQAHPRKEATRIPSVMEAVDRVQARLEKLILVARSVRPDFLRLGSADLRQVLQNVRAGLEDIASRRWRVESVGPVRIVADPERLGHALSLVAHRAIVGTREDDVITLGSVVLPGEARLWVRYRDRGASERIDELSVEHSTPVPGSGDKETMGLAVADAIAKAHRGRVTIAGGSHADVTITIVVPSDQPESWNGATYTARSNSKSTTRRSPDTNKTRPAGASNRSLHPPDPGTGTG
ncbi:MAG TPA: hypothetical protein VHF25_02270, partial [Nitriliruptorales bacterium]|nr:hypothetical protein [Nitriliruptorales bacterium]